MPPVRGLRDHGKLTPNDLALAGRNLAGAKDYSVHSNPVSAVRSRAACSATHRTHRTHRLRSAYAGVCTAAPVMECCPPRHNVWSVSVAASPTPRKVPRCTRWRSSAPSAQPAEPPARPLSARVPSFAVSLCTIVQPLYTRFTEIFGTSISENGNTTEPYSLARPFEPRSRRSNPPGSLGWGRA